MPKTKELAVALLDEPQQPMRTVIEQQGIEELAASITALGLLENLVVKPASGGRYEIVAGHRRLLALRKAGVTKAECKILEPAASHVAATLAENVDRQDANPADEAAFVARCFLENGEDVDKVCELMKRTRTWVEDRLLLVQGHERVMTALRDGIITLGVARELNMIDDEGMLLYYLSSAVSSGTTTRQMRTWRISANERSAMQREEDARLAAAGEAPPSALPASEPAKPAYSSIAKPWEMSGEPGEAPCRSCSAVHPIYRMFKWHVCQSCADRFAAELIRLGQC